MKNSKTQLNVIQRVYIYIEYSLTSIDNYTQRSLDTAELKPNILPSFFFQFCFIK